jgi:hypothetical protein
MTEAQWLACEDPDTMREFLRGEASSRKLRLFVCACCRGIWEQFTEEQGRKTIEVAERMADGQAEPGEVALARSEIEELNRINGEWWANVAQQDEATYLYGGQELFPCLVARDAIGNDVANCNVLGIADRRTQVVFLHDLFGLLPFRPVTLDSAWLTSTVVALARQMYESRDFSAMPILADALQDAGCDNDNILSHCRGPGPHVRGCWVVDLVLAKG